MSTKDSLSKEFFRTPERFSDTCNGILFNGRNIIKPYELSEIDIEYAYVNRSDKKSIVDIARRWNRNDVTIALIVQENQTNTDYAMVLRNMLSESLMYSRQLAEKTNEHHKRKDLLPGSEYISGIKKDDKFVPVITIVLYLGRDKWDASTQLYQMLEIDESLKPFVTNYKINLYDYNAYDNYENFKTDVALAFQALSAHGDKRRLKEIFCGEYQIIAPDTMRFIGTMLDIKNIDHYIDTNTEGEKKGYMCKALEDLKEEGREESLISLVIKKVKKNKSLEVIADEIEEEIEYIRPMYEAVIANPNKTATDIYELLEENN